MMPPLRPALRQARILELVAKTGEASVERLATAFATSPETIRRDLTVLAEAEQLRKVHGGARANTPQPEGAFAARMRKNPAAKQIIAEKLAKLVKPGQTLFLDTGSTTLICAEALLKINNLTIITNSTRIAARFSAGPRQTDVYLLAGQYRHDNAQTVGTSTISDIANYNADLAVLTIGAINTSGAMDYCHQETMVARAMISASATVALLADHSKFDMRAAFRLCPLSAVDTLVTDRTPNAPLVAALQDADVSIV